MNDLFEIGELGILRDIPAELSSKTKENIFLKTQISGYKKKILLLGLLLGGIAGFWVLNKYYRNKTPHDENANS